MKFRFGANGFKSGRPSEADSEPQAAQQPVSETPVLESSERQIPESNSPDSTTGPAQQPAVQAQEQMVPTNGAPLNNLETEEAQQAAPDHYDPESSESGVSESNHPDEDTGSIHNPDVREELQSTTPNGSNAQSLFPSEACVFVGNLSRRNTETELIEGLYSVMRQFGTCYIHTKVSLRGEMPLGFVQYNNEESARKALKYPGKLSIHGRVLRLEMSKANRTIDIGYRSGEPITVDEIKGILQNRGAIQKVTVREGPNLFHKISTIFGTVTFKLYGDCTSALQTFRGHDTIYIVKNMDDSQHTGPGQGDSSSNPSSHNRQWSNSRWPNSRRPHRPYNGGNGNGHGNGHGNGNGNSYGNNNGHGNGHGSFGNGNNNGHGNGNGYGNNNGHGNGHGSFGNGGNNGRGGYRNGPGHNRQGSFSAQSFPAPLSPVQNYHGGNQFAPGFAGGNNFNQGHPNFNPNFPGNFPQGHPGNNFPQNFQGYPPVGAFPNSPVMLNPAPEGFPPNEYPVLSSPPLPMFVPGSYPPGSYPPGSFPPIPPPMMAAPPGYMPNLPRRRTPRPNEPLIVSSQPQFDTERHRELYYYPGAPPMSPNWIDPSTGYYMPADYSQYGPAPGSFGYHPTMEPPCHGNAPGAAVLESPLAQIPTGAVEEEEPPRGRDMTRNYHQMTDGSSDMPSATLPSQTQSDSLTRQEDSTAETPNQPVRAQSVPAELRGELTEPENDPNVPQDEPVEAENVPNVAQLETDSEKSQSEPTEPEATVCAEESTQARVQDQDQQDPSSKKGDAIERGASKDDKAKQQPEIETKSIASSLTSDGVPGMNTPETDSDESKEDTTSSSPPKEHTTSSGPTEEHTTSSSLTEEHTTSSTPPQEHATPSTPPEQEQPNLRSAAPSPEIQPQVSNITAASQTDNTSFTSRKKLEAQDQPKTDTGKSVEQYVLEYYNERVAREPDFQFAMMHKLQEAVQELEDERRRPETSNETKDPESKP